VKKIKYISSIILIWLGIVLIGEIHSQQFIRNRDSSHTNASYNFGDDFRKAVEHIRLSAERNNIIAFIIHHEFASEIEHSYILYSTHTLPETVTKFYGKGNNLKSIIFGNIYVSITDISEAPAKVDGFLRLYGSSNNIDAFINELDAIYPRSSPVYEASPDTFYRNILVSYWCIVIIYIIFLTLVEVFFLKKEVFIRVSLGASISRIIGHNIFIDTIVYLMIFIIGGFIFAKTTSFWHEPILILMIFTILIIANLLVYLPLYKLDFKAVTSNSKIPKRVLKCSYLIKSFASIFAMFAITSSLTLIQPTIKYFYAYDFFAANKSHDFATFQYRFNESIFEDMMAMINFQQANTEMNNTIYFDYFEQLQPIALQNIFIPADNDCLPYDFGIIKANINSFDYLASVIKDFSLDVVTADICFLIPEIMDDMEMETALEFAKMFVHDDISYTVFYYGSGVDIIAINGGDFLLNEFNFVSDPVIIFDTTRRIIHNSGVMYNFTAEILDEIIERFGLEGETVRITNVFDVYNHFWFMIRVGVFASVLVSILALLLAIITIFNIISLEYTVNAIELCVKKILGYGVLKKNIDIIGELFISNLFCAVIAILIMVNIFYINYVVVLVAIGVIFFVDIVAILWSAYRIEKAQIVKILKGGTL